MTLAQKFNWTDSSHDHLIRLQISQSAIVAGKGKKFDYYCLAGDSVFYATSCYLEGGKNVVQAARLVVSSTLDYFYGEWRQKLPAPSGAINPVEWRKLCLWFEVVAESLPWVTASGDWKAVRKIAEYPPDDAFPEAKKAKGEAAWLRALICYLRDEPKANVEAYLLKAEADKSKRPKLLSPVLRALLDKNAKEFEKTFLAYMAFYRKSEFKLNLNKILAFDGTTLYHLGRKQGFKVELPENLADHVIRID